MKTSMEVTSSTASFKRRKLGSDVHQLVNNRTGPNSPENYLESPAISEDSDRAPVSPCSSCNDSSEYGRKRELRSVDLKVELHAEGYESEISKLTKCRFSRETTTSSEIFADTDEVDSSMATNPSAACVWRKHQETKMPPAAEIEEFFSAAEKQEEKRFADKYNYDVKKDVPLEGRYQWVRLKP